VVGNFTSRAQALGFANLLTAIDACGPPGCGADYVRTWRIYQPPPHTQPRADALHLPLAGQPPQAPVDTAHEIARSRASAASRPLSVMAPTAMPPAATGSPLASRIASPIRVATSPNAKYCDFRGATRLGLIPSGSRSGANMRSVASRWTRFSARASDLPLQIGENTG